jgi:hypothetical protein
MAIDTNILAPIGPGARVVSATRGERSVGGSMVGQGWFSGWRRCSQADLDKLMAGR